MSFARNKVIAGDYTGGAVVSILGEVSISYSPAGSLLLNTDTVESYEMIMDEHFKNAALGVGLGLVNDIFPDSVILWAKAMPAEKKRVQYIAIQFKDGKKSLLELDRDLCTALIKSCLSEAAARCRVTAEHIESCGSYNEGSCQTCSCFRCVVWPKCCLRRLSNRRTKLY